MQKLLLTFISLFLLNACFDDSSEDSGGGLFENHQPVDTTPVPVPDTTAPLIAITSPADGGQITPSTDSVTFAISGNCDENGKTVIMKVNGIPAIGHAGFLCNGTSFSGTIDTTGMATDLTYLFSATLTDVAGNTGTSATNYVDKVSYPIEITSFPIINIANVSAYTVSGTCGADGIDVIVTIGGSVSETLTCASGTFSTSALDVSALVDNAAVTINASHGTSNNNKTILKDIIAPGGVITPAAADVLVANVASYSLAGTCTEDGTVNIVLGSLSTTAVCSSGVWSKAAWDVSAEADALGIAITADLDDAAGNSATQATDSVDKDTVAPIVAITTPADSSIITDLTDSASFAINGTCDEAGQAVTIKIDSIAVTTSPASLNCDGTNFSGAIDTTSYAFGSTYAFTAELSDALGNLGVSATNNVTKIAYTVAISSAPAINIANKAAYIVSGTCSINGVVVTVTIGGTVINAPTCISGTFTTPALDVSAIADNAAVSVQAVHGSASTSTNVIKDTVAPVLAITPAASDVNGANAATYSLAGTCSEDGTVNLAFGGLTTTTNCTGGAWSVTGWNVSAQADNASVSITADLSDAASNPAVQATDSVSKDTIAPTVAITTPANLSQITGGTDSATFAVSGTCNESGQTVTIKIDGAAAAAPVGLSCDGTNFAGTIDTTGLAFGATYAFTAELSDPAANTGTSGTNSVDKVAYTVTISVAPTINIANKTTYIVSGSCSVDTQAVTITVGGSVVNSPTCTGGAFTTINMDVSVLGDNAAV